MHRPASLKHVWNVYSKQYSKIQTVVQPIHIHASSIDWSKTQHWLSSAPLLPAFLSEIGMGANGMDLRPSGRAGPLPHPFFLQGAGSASSIRP